MREEQSSVFLKPVFYAAARMAAKKEVSAVVVKLSRVFSQMFPVPDGESGQSCGVLELEEHQYGAEPDF